MAILNDLIVRGATRCLNTLYAKDLNTEDLTTSGYTYMGYSTARSDTKLSVAGISNDKWYRSTGTVGWYSDTYGGGIYMIDNTYVRTYGSKAFLAINGLYTGASAQYYLNSSGKLVVNEANANSLSTKFASVSDTLRATKYDLQTVTQMGTNGTLYVAPSIQFPTSNGGTTVTTTANSITITDTNITSATLAGIVWGAQAKVKISGTFNGVVSGTVDGIVTSINTTSKVLVIGSLSGGNWSSVSAGTYTASQIINLNITMYENASSKPVGILLTSYGAVSEHIDGTAKTYIDIYGGSNTKPVVRIGQMTNLDAINGVTPNGWGLYTTHGYFSGLIVSNEGKIGGWTLGSNALMTGTWGTDNSAMLCTGSDSPKTIADSGSISGWVFTAGANFGVTKTGAMYCTGAKVNGNITAQSLTIASNATITGSIPQANVTNLSTSLTNAAKTATNFISTVDSTGIMVHPNGNTTTGWKISNAIELLRNNDSYMKLWIDDDIAKVRIGDEDQGHIIIDNDSVDIKKDSSLLLATFGAHGLATYVGSGEPVLQITTQADTSTTIQKTESVETTMPDATLVLSYPPAIGTTATFNITITSTSLNYTFTDTVNITEPEEGVIIEPGGYEAVSEGSSIVIQMNYDFPRSRTYTITQIKKDDVVIDDANVTITANYTAKATAMEYRPSYTLGTRSSYENEDVGIFSFAEGDQVIASGYASHAEGQATQAKGSYSHAEGQETVAMDTRCHAEGYKTQASNIASHAEGIMTNAAEEGAHAEGYWSKATGIRAHAEGDSTLAIGTASHAEGTITKASGNFSHAEGENTEAVGVGSHAGGYWTKANADYQTVVGKWNITDNSNQYGFIIGNGTDNSRSDALAVTWGGNIKIALDTTAASDTIDANLYTAIRLLGWVNDVLKPA